MTITASLPRPAELAEQLRSAPEPPLPPPDERRHLRERAGVILLVAAQSIGVNIKTLRAWESGLRDPQGLNRRIYLVLLEAFRILIAERKGDAAQT